MYGSCGGPIKSIKQNGRLSFFDDSKELNAAIHPPFCFEFTQRDGSAVIAEVMSLERPVVTFISGPVFESLPAGTGRHEPRQTLASVEMPLSDEPRPVARRLQLLGNRLLRLAEAEIVGDHPVAMTIRSRHENGASGTTHRRIGEGVRQVCAFACKTIQVRCLHLAIAGASHVLSSHLIWQYQDDIRPFRWDLRGSGRGTYEKASPGYHCGVLLYFNQFSYECLRGPVY